MFDAAGVEQHARRRPSPEVGRLLDASGGDAGELLRPFGGGIGDGGGRLLEAGGVVLDELVIQHVVAYEHVEDGPEDGEIGSGLEAEEDIGVAGDRRHPRIHHDELRPPIVCLPDVGGGDRVALGDVGPGDEHDIRQRDVGPGVGRPVDAKCLLQPAAPAETMHRRPL